MSTNENDLLYTNRFIEEQVLDETFRTRPEETLEWRRYYGQIDVEQRRQQDAELLQRRIEAGDARRRMEFERAQERAATADPGFSGVGGYQNDGRNSSDRYYNRNARTLVIDSADRDTELYPDPADYTIDLPREYKNVKSIRLTSTEFPNTNQTVSTFPERLQNSKIYWRNKEDDDNEDPFVYSVTLTDGNYNIFSLKDEMEQKMNAVYRRADQKEHEFVIDLGEDTDIVRFRQIKSTRLPPRPISVHRGDNRILFYHPNHGFKNGDNVFIRGVTRNVAGIPKDEVNGEHVIVLPDPTAIASPIDVIDKYEGYEPTQYYYIRTETFSNAYINSDTLGNLGSNFIRVGKFVDFALLFNFSDSVFNVIGFNQEYSSKELDTVIIDIDVTDPERTVFTSLYDHRLEVGDKIFITTCDINTRPTIIGTQIVETIPALDKFTLKGVTVTEKFMGKITFDFVTHTRTLPNKTEYEKKRPGGLLNNNPLNINPTESNPRNVPPIQEGNFCQIVNITRADTNPPGVRTGDDIRARFTQLVGNLFVSGNHKLILPPASFFNQNPFPGNEKINNYLTLKGNNSTLLHVRLGFDVPPPIPDNFTGFGLASIGLTADSEAVAADFSNQINGYGGNLETNIFSTIGASGGGGFGNRIDAVSVGMPDDSQLFIQDGTATTGERVYLAIPKGPAGDHYNTTGTASHVIYRSSIGSGEYGMYIIFRFDASLGTTEVDPVVTAPDISSTVTLRFETSYQEVLSQIIGAYSTFPSFDRASLFYRAPTDPMYIETSTAGVASEIDLNNMPGGASFSIVQQGSVSTTELTLLDVPAGGSYNTTGVASHFRIFAANDSTIYYVWYNLTDIGNEVDPAIVGETGIQVDITSVDTKHIVALKTSLAMRPIMDETDGNFTLGLAGVDFTLNTRFPTNPLSPLFMEEVNIKNMPIGTFTYNTGLGGSTLPMILKLDVVGHNFRENDYVYIQGTNVIDRTGRNVLDGRRRVLDNSENTVITNLPADTALVTIISESSNIQLRAKYDTRFVFTASSVAKSTNEHKLPHMTVTTTTTHNLVNGDHVTFDIGEFNGEGRNYIISYADQSAGIFDINESDISKVTGANVQKTVIDFNTNVPFALSNFAGTYFDVYFTLDFFYRFWYDHTGAASPPSVPSNGILARIDISGDASVTDVIDATEAEINSKPELDSAGTMTELQIWPDVQFVLPAVSLQGVNSIFIPATGLYEIIITGGTIIECVQIIGPFYVDVNEKNYMPYLGAPNQTQTQYPLVLPYDDPAPRPPATFLYELDPTYPVRIIHGKFTQRPFETRNVTITDIILGDPGTITYDDTPFDETLRNGDVINISKTNVTPNINGLHEIFDVDLVAKTFNLKKKITRATSRSPGVYGSFGSSIIKGTYREGQLNPGDIVRLYSVDKFASIDRRDLNTRHEFKDLVTRNQDTRNENEYTVLAPREWDSAATYAAGDIVSYADRIAGSNVLLSYKALESTTGDKPLNDLYWEPVIDYSNCQLEKVHGNRAGLWSASVTYSGTLRTIPPIAIMHNRAYKAIQPQTGFRFTTLVQGDSFGEDTNITAVANSGVAPGILDGTYFIFFSTVTDAYYVWYDATGTTVDPAPTAGTDPVLSTATAITGIKVTISHLDTAATVATLSHTAISTFGVTGGLANVSPPTAATFRILTNTHLPLIPDTIDGATGTTFGILQNTDSFHIPEVHFIATAADVSGNLGGSYWVFYTQFTTGYYVWYDVDGTSSDPTPPPPSFKTYVGIEVDITENASASAVATATKSAIDGTIFSEGSPTVVIGGTFLNELTITNPIVAIPQNNSANVPELVTVVNINQRPVHPNWIPLNDEFYFKLNNGVYAQNIRGRTQVGGGLGVTMNSENECGIMINGYRDEQTNTLCTGKIQRPINLDGDDYVYMTSDILSSLDNTSNVPDVFAKILLSDPPGAVLFNTFESTTRIFRNPIPSLKRIHFQIKFKNNELYDFNNEDYSFGIEIVEYTDSLNNVGFNSQRGVVDQSHTRATNADNLDRDPNATTNLASRFLTT